MSVFAALILGAWIFALPGSAIATDTTSTQIQQRNEWSEPIVVVTGVSAIFSILVLIVYVYQLREMRRSTDAARDTAEATQNACRRNQNLRRSNRVMIVGVERLHHPRLLLLHASSGVLWCRRTAASPSSSRLS
jgi:hypothetical protein